MGFSSRTSPCLKRDTIPLVDGIGRLDDVHPSRLETIEGIVGQLREVHDPRYDDRRGAVFQQVDLARERRIAGIDVGEDVVDGPGDAVRLGLAGDDHDVVVQEDLDEFAVARADCYAARAHGDLRSNDRVVLRERIATLDLETGLASTSDAVKEDRLFDSRDQRVARGPKHGMVRPDGQVVLALAGELVDVVLEVPLQGVPITSLQGPSDSRVDLPLAALDVGGVDHGHRRCRVALAVDQEERVKDLHRGVGVQRREDVADHAHVAIEELGEAPVVLHRPLHYQLVAGRAEGVLSVDDHQGDTGPVIRGRRNAVLARPIQGFVLASAVGHRPDLVDGRRVEVGRDRQVRACHGGSPLMA